MDRRNLILILACLALLFLIIWIVTRDPLFDDLSGEYEKSLKQIRCIDIIGDRPNVRSEPVADRYEEGKTNSFGKVKKANFSVKLTKMYLTDRTLDSNGDYYGFEVEEILKTTEGKTWFPRGLKGDPDGIVWINERYVDVIE